MRTRTVLRNVEGARKEGGREREKLSRARAGKSKVELPVRIRSRGGFHGIIKMFVDVDGGGLVGVEGWLK